MNKFKKIIGVSFVVVCLAMLTSCADGDLNLEQPTPPDPSLAEIGSFQVCKVGMPETCADSLTIEEGQPVELIWETAKATSVEIASADGSFVASPLEASGSVVVEAVAASTRFTLSAMTADGVAQKDVAVEVAAPQIDVTASLTASKARIAEGETVDLCWTITPPDATITIKGDDGVTYFPAEGIEAKDSCIAILPAKTTVYTLTAKVADGREAPATASVEVDKKLTISISASAVSDANKVTLTWETNATDADTISINQGVGDVKSLTSDGKGSKEVEITQDTTYTITVTSGEQTQTASVVVAMPAREVDLEISINDIPVAAATEQPAEKTAIAPKAAVAATEKKPVAVNAGTFFEGEDVKLSWNASVNGAADKITSVKLLDSAGNLVRDGLLAADAVTLPVATDGQYILSVSGSGIKETKATIAVNVRKWVNSTDSGIATRETTAVAADATALNSLFAGYTGDMNEGKLQISKLTLSADNQISEQLLDLPLRELLGNDSFTSKEINLGNFADKMHTYPVNVIVQDPIKKERLFSGTSGALMMSDDSGVTWKLIKQNLMVNTDGKYPGSHKSCKGVNQEGIKGWELAGYSQVCDIIIDPDDGRLIMATDREILYLEFGVDQYLVAKDPEAATKAGMSNEERFKYAWAGMPEPGKPGNAVYGVVNHDLELVKFESGSKILYAATEKGLFSSSDLGLTWAQESSDVLGSIAKGNAKELFAITSDVKNNKLYVGAADGIYYKELSMGAADWQKATVGEVAPAPAPAAETPGDLETKKSALTTMGEDGKAAAADETPAPAPTGSKVFSITVDPIQAGSVYAATESGVVVSRDGGKTFKNVKNEKILNIASKADANGSVGIYAATATGMAVSIAKPVTAPIAAQPAAATAAEQPVAPAQEGGNVPTVGGEQPSTVEGGATGVNEQLL